MIKKILYIILIISIVLPLNIYARRGCCSHHKGVSGYDSSTGRIVCKDGTYSPSCVCEKEVTEVYGCTDSKAKNYNSNATKNDDSCTYDVYGCTDLKAKNYNSKATKKRFFMQT